jgi:hypothetical protein
MGALTGRTCDCVRCMRVLTQMCSMSKAAATSAGSSFAPVVYFCAPRNKIMHLVIVALTGRILFEGHASVTHVHELPPLFHPSDGIHFFRFVFVCNDSELGPDDRIPATDSSLQLVVTVTPASRLGGRIFITAEFLRRHAVHTIRVCERGVETHMSAAVCMSSRHGEYAFTTDSRRTSIPLQQVHHVAARVSFTLMVSGGCRVQYLSGKQCTPVPCNAIRWGD